LLSPSRGESGQESFDISEQITPHDPELNLADDSFGSPIGLKVAGLADAALGAVGISPDPTLFPTLGGTDGASLAEFGGNVFLPEGFESNLEGMDEQQRAEALVKNNKILESIKARGTSDDPRERLIQGARAFRAESLVDQEAVDARYSGFLQATIDKDLDDPIFAMANEDPLAFSLQYFEDRATLVDTWGKDKVQGLDKRARVYMNAAETVLSKDMLNAAPGSFEQRKQSRQLRSVQMTLGDMYKDYSVPEATNIRGSMPVGNAKLAGEFQMELEDPDRPRPVGTTSSSAMRSAVTTTKRLSDNPPKRLTKKQMDDLVLLYDHGILSAPDVTTAMMTGALPPQVKPWELQQFGDSVYGLNPDTGLPVFIMKAGSGGPPDRSRENKLTLDSFKEIKKGAQLAFPNAPQDWLDSLDSILLQDDTWLEGLQVDLSDPVDQRKIGMMYANAHLLSVRENAKLIPNSWEDAPSMRDILESPIMRSSIAQETDMRLKNILPFGDPFLEPRPNPDVPRSQNEGLNYNITEIREAMDAYPKSPDWPPGLTDIDPRTGKRYVDGLSNEALDEILTRYYVLEQQQQQ
jgi:hypothetical protein